MDPEVLKKAQKGDEEAFAQIVSEHQNLVYTGFKNFGQPR